MLEEYRGRGLGEELVREMVENGDLGGLRWLLHTENMHPLYRKFGFEEPNYKVHGKAADEERERERVAPGQSCRGVPAKSSKWTRSSGAPICGHDLAVERSRAEVEVVLVARPRVDPDRAACSRSVSACCGLRASSTGSHSSQRSQTSGIRSPVSRSNGSSTVPSSRGEYAAAIAYDVHEQLVVR